MKDFKLRLPSVFLYLSLALGFVYLAKHALLKFYYPLFGVCFILFWVLIYKSLNFMLEVFSGKVSKDFLKKAPALLSKRFSSKEEIDSFIVDFNRTLEFNANKIYYVFDFWKLYKNAHKQFLIKKGLPEHGKKFYNQVFALCVDLNYSLRYPTTK